MLSGEMFKNASKADFKPVSNIISNQLSKNLKPVTTHLGVGIVYTTLYNTLAKKPTDNLKHRLLQSMEDGKVGKSLDALIDKLFSGAHTLYNANPVAKLLTRTEVDVTPDTKSKLRAIASRLPTYGKAKLMFMLTVSAHVMYKIAQLTAEQRDQLYSCLKLIKTYFARDITGVTQYKYSNEHVSHCLDFIRLIGSDLLTLLSYGDAVFSLFPSNNLSKLGSNKLIGTGAGIILGKNKLINFKESKELTKSIINVCSKIPAIRFMINIYNWSFTVYHNVILYRVHVPLCNHSYSGPVVLDKDNNMTGCCSLSLQEIIDRCKKRRGGRGGREDFLINHFPCDNIVNKTCMSIEDID